jgi:beta-mannosidase
MLQISDDQKKISIAKLIHLEIGSNLIKKEFEIINPELWFPHGYGAHPLYTLKTEISTEKTMSTMSKRIGLRTLEVKREQDQWGESFTIVVNSIPIFAKGVNWIPSDSFTMRVSADKYRYLLTSAVKANMNMIRIWGGGIYETNAFYDLCDELGILVWQDFMFSCALYPGDEPFLKSVQQEATYQVRRLRHHPSLALWCGNNEIEMGWRDWKWHETMPASMWEDYLKVFHVTLPEVCHAEDPARLYWNSSPASDRDAILHPQASTHGDTHYWGVWHGKEPFDLYQKHFPRFISEYGFQSFPAQATVNKFTENEDHDIFSPVMLLHQKSPNGNALIKDYLEKNYVVPRDFNNFMLLTQVLQAEGIKIGAEHFRRIRPRCMGSIYWQLNDCWPVASWSSIDYYGRWKALHYYAKRFYAPILIVPHFENGIYQFNVISDVGEPIDSILLVNLLDFSGKSHLKFEKEVQIRPHESAIYYSLAKTDIPESIDPRETLLYCSLENDGKIISENAFYFELPKNQKLVPPGIDADFIKEKSGFSIILTTEKLARSVILKAGQIEGQFEDNFFNLLPGQKRQVRFIANSKISVKEFESAFSYLTLFDLMEFNLNYS